MLPLSVIDNDRSGGAQGLEGDRSLDSKNKFTKGDSGLIETLRYVHRSSAEFKAFIKKVEMNYDGSNKVSACLLCWGFLTSY